jgi:hypothetical protein
VQIYVDRGLDEDLARKVRLSAGPRGLDSGLDFDLVPQQRHPKAWTSRCRHATVSGGPAEYRYIIRSTYYLLLTRCLPCLCRVGPVGLTI